MFFTLFKLYTHIYLWIKRVHLVEKRAFSCQSTGQIPDKKILHCYKIIIIVITIIIIIIIITTTATTTTTIITITTIIIMVVIKNHLQGRQKYCHQKMSTLFLYKHQVNLFQLQIVLGFSKFEPQNMPRIT